MARVYCDEHFPLETAEYLRLFGHDALTCQESGRANKEISDTEVLAFAVSSDRAVLTMDRGDFKRLHRKSPNHCGIVSCTMNRNYLQLAQCIHEKLIAQSKLAGELVRVYRPDRPTRRTV